MRIAFGTDETTDVTEEIVRSLRQDGHEVEVVAAGDSWPDAGRRVGEAVAADEDERAHVAAVEQRPEG